MSTTSTPVREDAQICELLNSQAQALHAKDIDALMAHYAQDMVVFDIAPPLQRQGADAYRKNFEAWFATVDGPIDYQVHDLRITISGDTAFYHHLARVKATRTIGDKTGYYWSDYSVRVSAGCRKVGGRWKIIHEHISVPIDMGTTHAAAMA